MATTPTDTLDTGEKVPPAPPIHILLAHIDSIHSPKRATLRYTDPVSFALGSLQVDPIFCTSPTWAISSVSLSRRNCRPQFVPKPTSHVCPSRTALEMPREVDLGGRPQLPGSWERQGKGYKLTRKNNY